MNSKPDQKKTPGRKEGAAQKTPAGESGKYGQVSDEELMREFCRTLDDQTFALLMERHYRSALAIARSRLSGKGHAQDAVQEAFVRVVRKAQTFDKSARFSPWFYTILRNVCIDILRKENSIRGKHRQFSEETDNVIHRPRTDSFNDLISSLSAPDREVLIHRFVNRLTFKQINRIMDLSVEALKKRSQRALKKLHRHLSPDGTPKT